MKNHPVSIRLAFLGASAFALPQASAAIVGIENFNYADGSIANLSGGTGWNYVRTAEPGALPAAPSDWDLVGGVPTVSGGALITNGSSAKREYGGSTEGSAAGSNEREGAFRGTGSVFISSTFRLDSLLATGTTQWGGMSSYDFGAERIFFGLPSQSTATRFFGLVESGIGTTLSTIPVEANTTYTLVAMVNFDTDVIGLWVNPDGSDNATSYDVSRAYTATSWSTAVRLGSAAGTNATWDNLRVADNFAEAVPETSSALLSLLGGAVALRRRRI